MFKNFFLNRAVFVRYCGKTL